MDLTVSNLTEVFKDCLWKDEEVQGCTDADMIAKSTCVDGIMNKFAFNPVALEKNKEKINSLLDQLPSEFEQGWSFLQGCVTRTGEHWGEHPHMDQLFVLGQAIGRVKSCMPREMWNLLPGGMPYFIVEKR